MSFTHLHAASGYSLRYGASHPSALAERAAERGLDALALTDRDSLAGAVRFAKACAEAGIRPLFGVDLAVPGMPASDPGPVKRQRTAPSGAVRSSPRHRSARCSWPAPNAAGPSCAGW